MDELEDEIERFESEPRPVEPVESEVLEPIDFDFIDVIETWWYEKKRWPRSSEISKLVGRTIPQTEDSFRDTLTHLQMRGVDRMLFEGEFQPTKLDSIRQNVAIAVSNIHDQKRLASKLRSLQISETRYRGWLQDPLFSKFVEKRSEELIVEELPEVSKTLTRKASNGDLRATKLLLELTGRLQTSKTQVNVFNNRDSSIEIIRKLVEVIKRHVKDPLILEHIAQDFDRIMGVGSALERIDVPIEFEDLIRQPKIIEGSASEF